METEIWMIKCCDKTVIPQILQTPSSDSEVCSASFLKRSSAVWIFFKSVICSLVRPKCRHFWSTEAVLCNVWNRTSQSILRVRCPINLTACPVRECCTVYKLLVKYLRKIGWFLGSAWKFFVLQKLSDVFWGPPELPIQRVSEAVLVEKNRLKPEGNKSPLSNTNFKYT